MKPPQSENDLFEFAFDTEDKAYPIYREKIVSDKPSIACVATGIFISSFEMSYQYNQIVIFDSFIQFEREKADHSL